MFLKPFKVKSQTSIKGSDRKKLRAEIAAKFKIEADHLTEIVPNKEEMSVMKIITHSGEAVIVYNIKGNPAFFESQGVLHPTVYTLWQYMDMLPEFTTWPPVFKKLLGGADLMLPGVIPNGEVGPRRFGNLTLPKGAMCSIKLLGNKAPMAVGKTHLSTEDMYMSAMRGKAVVVLHAYSDLLWASGSKNHPPHIDDPEMIAASRPDNEEDDPNQCVNNDEAQTDKAERSDDIDNELNDLPGAEESVGHEESDECLLGAVGGSRDAEHEMPAHSVEAKSDSEEETTNPQEVMDKLLTWCFMCAVKTHVKKADLPLLTSNFFRNHLIPCCPPNQYLDIKKSSYKKLSKFLKSMQDRGFIKVKELTKGVESIIEVEKSHLELRDFQAPVVLEKEEQTTVRASTDAEFVPPEIVEMFTVTAASLPFFKLAGYNKGSALMKQDIKKALTDYIHAENLKQQKGQVILDPVLSHFLLTKNETDESLSWEEMINRTTTKMNPAFSIGHPKQQHILKKGKLEPITFNVAQRGGNKKVTLIHNLEVYGIEPQELGHRIQVSRACSTSVSPRPGKLQGMELLVQGNQVNFVADLLLEKYKVPRRYLLGIEKGPKSGKKR